MLKFHDAPTTIRETVMLVDDESRIRDIARRTLVRLGYAVVEAESGPAAIKLFGQFGRKIDCVLLDRNMPEMSGIETLETLRLMRPELPVVFVTGDSDEQGVDELLSVGADAVLTKPFELQQLAAVVRATIDGSRAANSWIRQFDLAVAS